VNEDECLVNMRIGKVILDGDLCITPGAVGLVVFAHGSGSSRQSPRNRYVARELRKARLATLLFDLLTPEEEAEDTFTGALRFDIDLLANKLVGVTDWLQMNQSAKGLNLGYFGASTGAAAALVAATVRPRLIKAIVSRGGRPDLAAPVLGRVQAPTLLIVGGKDFAVIDMNRDALNRLKIEKRLTIVPGATHLFEEQGALEQVAEHAKNWFLLHLSTKKPNFKKEPVK
jgi:putative phosphoribosyl transferase